MWNDLVLRKTSQQRRWLPWPWPALTLELPWRHHDVITVEDIVMLPVNINVKLNRGNVDITCIYIYRYYIIMNVANVIYDKKLSTLHIQFTLLYNTCNINLFNTVLGLALYKVGTYLEQNGKVHHFNGRKIIVIINVNEKNFITTRSSIL